MRASAQRQRRQRSGKSFDLGDWLPLLEAALLLFLLVCGLALLRGLNTDWPPLRITLGLPRRAASRAEWATGAAIGMGMGGRRCVAHGSGATFNTQLWMAPRAFLCLGSGLLTLAAARWPTRWQSMVTDFSG